MKRKLKLTFCLFFSLFTTIIYAAPSEVVIIAHADRLDQKEPGITLSAKGLIRANNFANYFVAKFGAPDAIIASRPVDDDESGSSALELETLLPLANYLVEKFPDKKPEKQFPLLFKYGKDDYKKLVKKLLKDNDLEGKLVVICWDRSKIDNVAKELGAVDIESPKENEFDTVYDIKFDSDGNVVQADVLKDQYPVNFSGTWGDLHELIN